MSNRLFLDDTAQLILQEMQSQNTLMNAIVNKAAGDNGSYNDATTKEIINEIKKQNNTLSQILNKANENENEEALNESYLSQMLEEIKKQSSQLQNILETGTWSINGAPLPPNDGKEYVMKDGEWVELEPLVTPNYYPENTSGNPDEPVIQEKDGKWTLHYYFPYKFATKKYSDIIEEKISTPIIFQYKAGKLENIKGKTATPNNEQNVDLYIKIVNDHNSVIYDNKITLNNTENTLNIDQNVYDGDKLILYTTTPYMEAQNLTLDIVFNIGENLSNTVEYTHDDTNVDLQPNIYLTGLNLKTIITEEDKAKRYSADLYKRVRSLKTPPVKRIHKIYNSQLSIVDDENNIWVSNIANNINLLKALELDGVPTTPIKVENEEVLDVVFYPNYAYVMFKDGSIGIYNNAATNDDNKVNYMQRFENFNYMFNHPIIENSNYGNVYITELSNDKRSIFIMNTQGCSKLTNGTNTKGVIRANSYIGRIPIDKNINKLCNYFFLTEDHELYSIRTINNNHYDKPIIERIPFNYGEISNFWVDNLALYTAGTIYVLNDDNELYVTSQLTKYPGIFGTERIADNFVFYKVQNQFDSIVKDVQCYSYYNYYDENYKLNQTSSTMLLLSDGRLYHAGRDYELDLDHTKGYFEQIYPEFKFHDIKYSCNVTYNDLRYDGERLHTDVKLMDGADRSIKAYSMINTSLLAKAEYIGEISNPIPNRKVVSLVHFDTDEVADETNVRWSSPSDSTKPSTVDTNAKFGKSVELKTGLWTRSRAFELGSADFTIDFWARPIDGGTYAPLLILSTTSYTPDSGQYDSGDIELLSLELYNWAPHFTYKLPDITNPDSNTFIKGTVNLQSLTEKAANIKNDGKWHHFAMVYEYEPKLFSIYIDGIRFGKFTNFGISREDYSRFITLGHGRVYSGATYGWYNGMIDELRVIDGEAIWKHRFDNALPEAPYDLNNA